MVDLIVKSLRIPNIPPALTFSLLKIAVLVYFLALTACRTATPIAYNPNPSNVQDPVSVIKRIIQQQPAAYAYMPFGLDVDDQCIQLYMSESSPSVMPIVGGTGGVVLGPRVSNVSAQSICYKNIGRIGLSYLERDKLWRVEVDDRSGNYMYWVYSYEKSDAERFIDAVSNFLK